MVSLHKKIKVQAMRYFNVVAIVLYVFYVASFYVFIAMSLSDNTGSASASISAFQRLLTTDVFWLFSLLYLALVVCLDFIYIQKISKLLGVIQALERWASHSNKHGESHAPSLSTLQPDDSLSRAVIMLSNQVLEAKNSDGQFDQMIREGALLDGETGIGNRQFFSNRLEALLREEDAQGAVFFIQFKECDLVQALYGHAQVINLLNTLIEGIQHRLKDNSNYFIARRNEFELALLLPAVYANQAEKLAGRLLNNLMAVSLPKGINRDEFVHIGISYFSHKQESYQVMAEADMALRNAQLQGPSQWFMYDLGEVERESAKGSLRWRTFLLKAINKNGFVIFFQPVISSEGEETLHHEVLSKVRGNDGSLISARVFLPMASKCGLIHDIDLLICEQVCNVMSYEKKQNDCCSINLSIESLLSVKFLTRFYETLDRFPLVSKNLIVEVSEYHLVNHLTELKPILDNLSRKGIRILADKVGQHVVSAKYLKVCPISFIKLHRSIVMNINEKIENQLFVQSLKAVCEQNQVKVFALGVESLQEWRMLMQLGITGGQGHFFTEPVAQVANVIQLP